MSKVFLFVFFNLSTLISFSQNDLRYYKYDSSVRLNDLVHVINNFDTYNLRIVRRDYFTFSYLFLTHELWVVKSQESFSKKVNGYYIINGESVLFIGFDLGFEKHEKKYNLDKSINSISCILSIEEDYTIKSAIALLKNEILIKSKFDYNTDGIPPSYCQNYFPKNEYINQETKLIFIINMLKNISEQKYFGDKIHTVENYIVYPFYGKNYWK